MPLSSTNTLSYEYALKLRLTTWMPREYVLLPCVHHWYHISRVPEIHYPCQQYEEDEYCGCIAALCSRRRFAYGTPFYEEVSAILRSIIKPDRVRWRIQERMTRKYFRKISKQESRARRRTFEARKTLQKRLRNLWNEAEIRRQSPDCPLETAWFLVKQSERSKIEGPCRYSDWPIGLYPTTREAYRSLMGSIQAGDWIQTLQDEPPHAFPFEIDLIYYEQTEYERAECMDPSCWRPLKDFDGEYLIHRADVLGY